LPSWFPIGVCHFPGEALLLSCTPLAVYGLHRTIVRKGLSIDSFRFLTEYIRPFFLRRLFRDLQNFHLSGSEGSKERIADDFERGKDPRELGPLQARWPQGPQYLSMGCEARIQKPGSLGA